MFSNVMFYGMFYDLFANIYSEEDGEKWIAIRTLSILLNIFIIRPY